VLDLESPALALVFARTRTEVDELAEKLRGRGYQVEALHGGLSQDQRDRVMKRVRTGSVDLLVATDVAARGLDVEQLSHVVNFNVPASPESYVHRIGRTGRAGREGVAITLAEPREHRLLRNIEHLTKQKIDVATVPTPMDVRARRLDMTRGALRGVLEEGDLDSYRVVTDALASEFDPLDVAAAAVKLAHQTLQADAAQDEEHIPSIDPRAGRESSAKAGRPERFARERRDAPEAGPRARPPERSGPVGPSLPRAASALTGHRHMWLPAASANRFAARRWCGCSSAPVAVRGCALPIWSAPSRTKPTSAPGRSVPSRSRNATRWSKSPTRSRKTRSAHCARRPCGDSA
jgi:ATP-dependent RNA helicase DeaD